MPDPIQVIPDRAWLHHGDSRQILASLPENYAHAVITDPPYGMTADHNQAKARNRADRGEGKKGFMDFTWDGSAIEQDPTFWEAVYRVMMPGAYLLAFAAPRTYHRMTCAIEIAGFDIKDMIHWAYGDGMIKSRDVTYDIDRIEGAEREILGTSTKHRNQKSAYCEPGLGVPTVPTTFTRTGPGSDLGKKFDGYGTTLRPSHEPICVARKPLSEGSVAANLITHGTGGINLGAYRDEAPLGNNPANLFVTHHPDCRTHACVPGCAVYALLVSGGDDYRVTDYFPTNYWYPQEYDATLYVQKPLQEERHAGCEEIEPETWVGDKIVSPDARDRPQARLSTTRANSHPTVKPIDLMRRLCKLFCPADGLVLDPFNGSGSTGCGALMAGMRYVGMDLDERYLQISEARIRYWAGVGERGARRYQRPNEGQKGMDLFEAPLPPDTMVMVSAAHPERPQMASVHSLSTPNPWVDPMTTHRAAPAADDLTDGLFAL